jgi:nucleotide-binding universal stress UspA family protein
MRILVTTDGSRPSLGALSHAAHFAKATDAELLVLRVLDPRIDCADDSITDARCWPPSA